MTKLMTNTGLSSRSLLLLVSIVVLAGAAALFFLSDSRPERRPTSGAANTSSPKDVPPTSLDTTAESAPTRAIAPQEQEAAETSSAASSKLLIMSGTVLDARSRSVAPDAEIVAFAGPLPGGRKVRAETRSDAQGRYELRLAIPGDLAWDDQVWALHINATGDRFPPTLKRFLQADFRPHPTDPSAWVAEHDFEIDLLFALRGRLVRESDGTPIADGQMALLSFANPALPQLVEDTTTEASGRFLIQMKSVEPDHLMLLPNASGYLAKLLPLFFDPTNVADVGDIALAEGACLEGIVTTPNGSPPAATSVYVHAKALGDDWIYLRAAPWALRDGLLVPTGAGAKIRPDGSFRVCGLVPDEYQLSASNLGCNTAGSSEFVDVRAPASGIRLQISRAVYRLHVFDAKSGIELERSQFLFDGPQGLSCYVQGVFVITADPGVEYPGKVVADGYCALRCTLPALVASEVRDLEFRIEPLPRMVACTIVVTSPTGTPVDQVFITIRADELEAGCLGPLPVLNERESAGRFELPKLPPGTYHLEVDPRREFMPNADFWLGAATELKVHEGMEPVEIQLGEGGLVHATVTKTTGEPVDSTTWLVRTREGEPEPLDWHDDAGNGGHGWLPKQSNARLARPLAPGLWTIRFGADGCKTRDVDILVESGRTVAIEVALELVAPR